MRKCSRRFPLEYLPSTQSQQFPCTAAVIIRMSKHCYCNSDLGWNPDNVSLATVECAFGKKLRRFIVVWLYSGLWRNSLLTEQWWQKGDWLRQIFLYFVFLPSTPRYRSIALGSAMMPERFVASAYVEWQSCDALFFRRSSLTRQTERFVRAKRRWGRIKGKKRWRTKLWRREGKERPSHWRCIVSTRAGV